MTCGTNPGAENCLAKALIRDCSAARSRQCGTSQNATLGKSAQLPGKATSLNVLDGAFSARNCTALKSV